MAQDAIEAVENKENTEAKILLKLLENAFSDEPLEKILEEFLPMNEKCKYYQNFLNSSTSWVLVNVFKLSLKYFNFVY